ncbi:class I SAM-dependent methyltransferase [Tessaracoccus antarcticus]|uniref:Class I SAM-dependent methyltransferase n=2 Tax=Tessaracoccus antarcticus TaxID=2479848 RepID=A0A3M0G1G2_9ACTN|nr:class I SAM-dependent methyltransferase [Tessaracoccus antarcticus]
MAAASAEADPGSLGAAGRMRKDFPPELAAAALSQVTLRRRARPKLPWADDMFFTPEGLEQATRHEVAAWRARQFLAAGIADVFDLGCGIGADSMAFLEAGLVAHAVETDPDTAALATANLALMGGNPVLVARAEDVDVPERAGVFLDPARRTDRGRTWRVEDFSPPWSLVLHHLAAQAFCCVKMGPGLPKGLIPDGVRATWVSHRGDVVEASLWNGAGPARAAVVFPRDGGAPVELAADVPRELPVRPPGRFVIEPDNAVVRAGLVTEIQPQVDLWLLDEHTAYLSADEPVDTPLADCFEVVDILDYDIATLRRYVAQHNIGTLEIKKRAIDVDPAALRKQLRPRGAARATLILARTPRGARVIVANRLRL